MKNHIPIRMCIICKARKEQKSLFRFGVKMGKIHLNLGTGRSFYVCSSCLNKDEKAFRKIKIHNLKVDQQDLKELVLNVKG
ncbi:DUF448 domain-containing protein [Campylobacter sp. MIT 99-7217]|uniref:DUF448 domain-containing protein n=1 Tax=Campylobacter sp. MIT 99-7217 TaxID=535091 RepID=UPI00163D3CD9|nr:DUF448 domain-containing protein [Campylobacter sp. MIT 99-7217]